MHSCFCASIRLFALVTFVVGLSGTALAQTNPCAGIDEAWQGNWASTITLKDCDTGFVFFSDTMTDTVCPDDCFDTGDETTECELTFEGNTAVITCTASEPAGPGCTAESEAVFEYTLSGDTITGTGTQTLTYTGDCPPELQDQCLALEFSAERVGGSDVCSVPLDLLNWSILKGSYR